MIFSHSEYAQIQKTARVLDNIRKVPLKYVRQHFEGYGSMRCCTLRAPSQANLYPAPATLPWS